MVSGDSQITPSLAASPRSYPGGSERESGGVSPHHPQHRNRWTCPSVSRREHPKGLLWKNFSAANGKPELRAAGVLEVPSPEGEM